MITTAGSDLNSICYEQHEYAIKVRDGVLKDDRFLPVIYAADKEDDPFVEETWIKANPNYGVSVKKDYIKEQAEKAKANKAYLNTFLRLHLNIWTDVETVWITDEMWMKQSSELDITLLDGQACYGGLDLSSKSDITAFTLMFPPNYDRDYYPEKYLTFTWSWLPEDKPKDSADKNNNNYKKWVYDGWVEETSGNVIDYDHIEEKISELCSRFDVLAIAYDPYNSTQIVSKMESNGLNMKSHRQGFVSMNYPTLEFEIKVKRGELLHDGNPVMRWMVSNGVLKSDSGGKLFKVDKNQHHQKIDGLVTNIMALSLALDGDDGEGTYLESGEMMYVDI
jgi:phage terminase large subunit-like protein